jgi:hypothetical protein
VPSTKHAPFEAVSRNLRCPNTDAKLRASPDPRTARALVPRQPVDALICRYWGLDDEPRHRQYTFAEAQSVASPPAAQRMALLLNRLRPYPVHRVGSCPQFGGRSVVIYFHYLHASDDPVRISMHCLIPVSNGRVVKIGYGLPQGSNEVQPHWPDEGLR